MAGPELEDFVATLDRAVTAIDEAARAVGSSKRTLARRMQEVVGTSPLSYVQSLRVERAVHLLKTTDASVDDVRLTGIAFDAKTLRVIAEADGTAKASVNKLPGM